MEEDNSSDSSNDFEIDLPRKDQPNLIKDYTGYDMERRRILDEMK